MLKKVLLAALSAFLLLTGVFLFSPALSAAASPLSAPGGTVDSAEALVTALGGEKAAEVKDGAVLLLSDICLRSPLTLTGGDFLLLGAGCVITADFDGSFLTVGDGESSATLTLGQPTTTSSEDLIFSGGGSSATGSMLYVCHGSTLTVLPGTIFRDFTSTVSGGAIFCEGTLHFYGGVVENCHALGSGGAVASRGEATFYSGKISSCSADLGGAIYSEGTLDLSGTEILSCTASRGGGVFSCGTFTLSSSSLSDCTAQKGGGIYNSSDLTLSGGQIIGCSSEEEGGGLYNSGSSTFCGTYFDSCSSPNGGSAFNNAQMTLQSGMIYGGQADVCGGNLFNSGNGTVTMEGCGIGLGKAVYGGGIFNFGTLTVSGGGFNANKAELGGALFNAGSLTFADKAFVDDGNDLAILLTEDGAHALRIDSSLFSSQVAVLTPVTSVEDAYLPLYAAGERLLTGDFVEDEFGKFSLSDGAWKLSASGLLKQKLPFTETPLFFLLLALAFVLTVALMTVCIRLRDRRLSLRDTAKKR